MADIFISYSRRDAAFVRQLHDAMIALKRDVWVDFEDIPLSADWWTEITSNIESADTVIFVITPDSLASPICHFELAHAIALNKRFIPVVRVMSDENAMVEGLSKRAIDDNMRAILAGREMVSLARQNWLAISRHNWLFFYDEAAFEGTFQKLITVIDTDLAHVKKHTRLLVKASEWVERQRTPAYLLSSGEIHEYSQWVRESSVKEPKPTEIQLEYLFVSQRNANRRLAATYIGLMIGLVVAGVLIAVAYLQNQRLTEGEQTRVAFEVQAIANQATANAQALILTEQRATGEANVFFATSVLSTLIARQTALVQDQAERFSTAEAGFITLTQQAQAQATATSIVGTLDALALANTQIVGTLTGYEILLTSLYEVADILTPSGGTEMLITPPAPPIILPSATPLPTWTPMLVQPSLTLPPPTMEDAGIEALPGDLLYVDASAGSDANDCLTSDAPCQTINAALAKSAPVTTIQVGYGIYNETLTLVANTTLIGADRDLTIINGNNQGSVVTIGVDARLDIQNMTITGGLAGADGGGIQNLGTLVARNLVITGNNAQQGGGLANFGAASLINTSVRNNLSSTGGGVFNGYDARYFMDNQTQVISNQAVLNASTNDAYRVTCAADTDTDGFTQALNTCPTIGAGQACLVSPTVTVINGDGTPFDTPGSTISINTVTELQLASSVDTTRGQLLINNNQTDITANNAQQSQIYVRGADALLVSDAALAPGTVAVTTPGFSSPLNIRNAPTVAGEIVTAVYTGVVVVVLEGPVSADGYQWWRVRLPNGAPGWAVDAVDGMPTLQRANYGGYRGVANSVSVGAPYAIYGTGARGVNLRATPGTRSALISTLVNGSAVTTVDGPTVVNGENWWYIVTGDNQYGWVVGMVEGSQTLLPIVTERVGVPTAYQFENGLCARLDENPIRVNAPAGSLRITLSAIG